MRYAVLPGLLPRIKSLFFTSFHYLGFYIALVYAVVKLIPRNHPYLLSANIGKFGIRHVVAAASQNLRFSWRHIDQVIVFFGILASLGILLLYFLGMVFFVLANPAFAGPFGGLLGGSPFETGQPFNDIAFMMMDRVFGVPGVFGSKVAAGAFGPWPTPFHYGLHALFKFFSMGMLFLAGFVFLYHITSVVLETTMTGTPFGRRFEDVWVPIRLVVAAGLLIPIGYGLNSAQWITLHAAKYGSGAATNAWIKFNQASGETPLGGSGAAVARPQPPDYSGLTKQLGLIRTCVRAYETMYKDQNSKGGARVIPVAEMIRPYAVKGSSTALDIYEYRQGHSNLDLHAELLKFYGHKEIHIVFGEQRDEYVSLPGSVKPWCGEIAIPVSSLRPEALFVQEGYLHAVLNFVYPSLTRDSVSAPANADQQYCADRRPFDVAGSNKIRKAQLCFCDNNNDGTDDGTGDMAALGNCNDDIPYPYWQTQLEAANNNMDWGMLAGYQYLTNQVPNLSSETEGNYSQTYYAAMDGKYAAWLQKIRNTTDNEPIAIDAEILSLGWGGAGIWYNHIAELNGSLIGAARSMPVVARMPHIMEEIAAAKSRTDREPARGCGRFNPNMATGYNSSSFLPDDDDNALAHILYRNCQYFSAQETIPDSADARMAQNSDNPIIEMMNVLFGTKPLFDFRANSETHPLAQMAALGRALIEKAIINYSAGLGGSMLTGISKMSNADEAAILAGSGKILSSVGTAFAIIALTAGIVLYYIVPIMPFMYFFFSVGRWVKTVFEAMVGVPLWALAHLSMGGNGLPGKAASNGYFLILEIFIRPTLSVFGLLASLSIFTAMISVLNMLFDVAVENSTGFNPTASYGPGNEEMFANFRSSVDQFFFMILYVIISYMIATSSFKMIDLIPDNVMRWAGIGVQTFAPGDNADEMVDSISGYTVMAVNFNKDIINSAGGAIEGVMGGLAQMNAAEASTPAAPIEPMPQTAPPPPNPDIPTPEEYRGNNDQGQLIDIRNGVQIDPTTFKQLPEDQIKPGGSQ